MKKLLALSISLFLLLAACAPRTQEAVTTPDAAPIFSSPAAQETDRVAQAAYHRMELERLQGGTYTTNVLINLDVPTGVRWILVEPTTDTSYTLRFTSADVPGAAWIVTPDGVEPRQVEEETSS